MRGVAVCRERPAGARRSATAGWYRAHRSSEIAARQGSDALFVDADCFLDATKSEVLALLAERFGQIDHLIYSVAAPRRSGQWRHPYLRAGTRRRSVPQPYAHLHRHRRAPHRGHGDRSATEQEREATVAVMGGADWASWVRHALARGLPAPGFSTVALSHIGPELTSAIYRRGTIGAAKRHLEDTARAMDAHLRPHGSSASTGVLGCTVTQAAASVPGICLYLALLRRALGCELPSTVDPSKRLWDHLADAVPLTPDADARIRLDAWETDPTVQDAVRDAWHRLDQAQPEAYADTLWLRDRLHELYGFGVPGVDYTAPVELDVPWPAAV
ncbi:enoyl-[acyl-carrier-protein] reductase FabV [Streptomyces sp. NPDC018019]|uniref:enoyl-[acyl-carrier-protein] reductase FabV n=1 Tax=Streptomyces sp. NPDC018019 TaxID=3365030 RepID=UPI0037AF4E41